MRPGPHGPVERVVTGDVVLKPRRAARGPHYVGSFSLMVAAFALAARLSDTDDFAYALPRFCLRALGVGAAIVS